jgi:RNA polymerase sigma-70 factor (ECF subfamily)
VSPVAHRPSSPALEQQRASDAALATALMAGEPGAPAIAWRRLSPLVMRFVQRTSAGADNSQDVGQEIFVRFFMRIAELRDPRALRPFLFGICLGVTLNEQRRRRVRRAVRAMPDEVLEQQAIAPAPDSDAREALRRLCCILGAVAPADRDLFVSRHVDKAELADIASRQRWSLPVTKRRVARMNRRLGLAMLADPALESYARGFFSRCGDQARGRSGR